MIRNDKRQYGTVQQLLLIVTLDDIQHWPTMDVMESWNGSGVSLYLKRTMIRRPSLALALDPRSG